MWRLSAWFLLSTYCLPFGHAAGPGDVEYRIGWEIELRPEASGAIVTELDFDHIEHELKDFTIPESYFRDYLDSREALDALPLALRRTLTEGLNLEGPKFQLPTVEELRSIRGSTHAPRVATPHMDTQAGGKVLLPQGTAQRLLNDRWNRLPVAQKREHARLRYFSKKMKTAVAFEILSTFHNKKDLQFKPDSPLRNRLETHFDGLGSSKKALEIKQHRDAPLQNIDDAVREFVAVVDRLGLRSELLVPRVERSRDTANVHLVVNLEVNPRYEKWMNFT